MAASISKRPMTPTFGTRSNAIRILKRSTPKRRQIRRRNGIKRFIGLRKRTFRVERPALAGADKQVIPAIADRVSHGRNIGIARTAEPRERGGRKRRKQQQQPRRSNEHTPARREHVSQNRRRFTRSTCVRTSDGHRFMQLFTHIEAPNPACQQSGAQATPDSYSPSYSCSPRRTLQATHIRQPAPACHGRHSPRQQAKSAAWSMREAASTHPYHRCIGSSSTNSAA